MSATIIAFPEQHHDAVSSTASLSANRTSLLTAREAEILRLARDTNKEIAFHLNISEHTVRATFRQIAMKLGTRSRTAAFELVYAPRVVEMPGQKPLEVAA